MTFLSDVLPLDFINALGWTILHSAWQILGIAGLLAIVLLILNKSTSSIRYFSTIIALFLIMICSLFTFMHEYQILIQNESIVPKVQFESIQSLNIQSLNTAEKNNFQTNESVFVTIKDFLQRNIDLFVFLWLIGINIYFIKFLGGFVFLQRLKSKNSKILSDQWQSKIKFYCEKMNINKPIRSLRSTIIKTPVVIGYFKPVILFPLSLFSGMPAEQIETIIIHELAHIYRKDYLINILQSFIEILYFYHPLIWWISGIMRLEREKCCDEIVVENYGTSTNYIKALSKLAAPEQVSHNPALAFITTKNALLKRIKYITKQYEKGFNNYSGFFSSVLIIITLFTFAYSINNKNSFDDINQSSHWWYPILKKHNIEAGAFSNFLNVFESGDSNSINKINRITMNATIIVNAPKDYLIINSSKAIFTYIDSTYRFEDAKLNRYSKIDSQIKSTEMAICKNLEIKFIKSKNGGASYFITNLDKPKDTNNKYKWMPKQYSGLGNEIINDSNSEKNLLTGEWKSDYLKTSDSISIAENIIIKTWHGVEIEATTLKIDHKQGMIDTDMFKFLIMNNKIILNFNNKAKDKYSYTANEIYKEGRFIRLLGNAKFLSDELKLKANEMIVDLTGSE